MNRTEYYYNPATCSYEQVEWTWRDWATYVGSVLGLAALLVSLSMWMLDVFAIPTLETRFLRAENRDLVRRVNQVGEDLDRFSNQVAALAERDRTLYRRLLQIKPVPEGMRQVGVGGSGPYRRDPHRDGSARSPLRRTWKKLNKLERRVRLRQASYRELVAAAERRSRRLNQLPAIRPANRPIVSGYGVREHPVLERPKKHEGVDFALRPGTPVVATGDGTVDRASYSANYGRFVRIRHPGSGHQTLYAHLSSIDQQVRPDAEVARGDTIGYSGNTGRTTGPHLHYEVQTLDGRALDPARFFVPDVTPKAYRALERRTRGGGK